MHGVPSCGGSALGLPSLAGPGLTSVCLAHLASAGTWAHMCASAGVLGTNVASVTSLSFLVRLSVRVLQPPPSSSASFLSPQKEEALHFQIWKSRSQFYIPGAWGSKRLHSLSGHLVSALHAGKPCHCGAVLYAHWAGSLLLHLHGHRATLPETVWMEVSYHAHECAWQVGGN